MTSNNVQRTLETETIDLTTLLKMMGYDDWDAVMFTDGSGTVAEKPGGYAAIVSTRDGVRKIVHGAMSHASVSTAELSAVLFGLLWYENQRPDTLGRRPSVHIFSDSKSTVVEVGAGRFQPGKQTGPLWAAIRMVGIRLNVVYHWLPRSTTGLNKICDLMAGLSRRTLESLESPISQDVLFSCNPIMPWSQISQNTESLITNRS